MEINGLFDETSSNLEKAMRIATQRQAVISQNIANAKTPGYVAKEFDEELMQAVERQNKREVVLEEELAALTRNSGKYSYCVKMLTSKVNLLKTIASQGRK